MSSSTLEGTPLEETRVKPLILNGVKLSIRNNDGLVTFVVETFWRETIAKHNIFSYIKHYPLLKVFLNYLRGSNLIST